jgi:hypothetical protein
LVQSTKRKTNQKYSTMCSKSPPTHIVKAEVREGPDPCEGSRQNQLL